MDEPSQDKQPTFAEQLQSLTVALYNTPEGKQWVRMYKKHVSFYRNETEQAKANLELISMFCGRKDVIKFIESCLNEK